MTSQPSRRKALLYLSVVVPSALSFSPVQSPLLSHSHLAVYRPYRSTTAIQYHHPVVTKVSLKSGSPDEDKNDTTSALYYSSATASPGDTVVQWEELLRAVVPIYCDEDDEECILLQHQSLEELKKQHESITLTDISVIGASVVAAATAFLWLISVSGPGAWRYFLAGGVCAMASHVIPVPIDVVKTRKQVDPAISKMHFWNAFRYILKNEGPIALWSGLGPTAVGYLLEGALKFGVYEVLKPGVSSLLARLASLSYYFAFLNSKVMAFAISAAVSGVAASIMLCPMEALRIRMVANPETQSKGSLFTAYRMLKDEGVSSMFKGMMPMMYKQVPYTVTKNVSFDFITRYAYTVLLLSRPADAIIGPTAKFAVPFAAAAVTSVLSCVTSQPGDMLLSLVNAHTGDRRRTRDIVHDILKSERGVKGFFVGIKTRFLHVGIIVTLQLLIYDMVKRFCGIAATGMAR